MPKKTTWAFDLGAWSMKIARGRLGRGGDIVVDLYDEVNYHGLGVDAEGGFLAGVREAVEEFAGRHTIGVKDDLCVSVSGSGVFSRFINLPPVPDSVDDIIQYEAMQQIPFDMDQVVWDYQTLKEEHEPWEEVKVGLFALKNEAVDELMEILSPWRRNLRVLQQAPLAVYNFMCVEGYNTEPAIIVDVGGKSTGVIVMNPPEFWLRSLHLGGDLLSERIETHFGVTRHEAERIKERAGESGRAAQLLRVVGKPVGNILGEIQRSLGYYKSLAPDVKLNKVIAVGNAFRLNGLDRVIAEGLQTGVEVVKETKNIALTKNVKREVGDGVCGCCALFGLIAQGLGVGYIKVNMVPEEIAFENEMRGKKPILAGAVAGLMAVIGILILGENLYENQLQEYRDLGTGISERVSRLDREYSSIETRAVNVQNELARLLSGNRVRRDVFMHVLSEFTRDLPREGITGSDSVMPAGIYVRELEFLWVPRSQYEDWKEGRIEAPSARRGDARPGRETRDTDIERSRELDFRLAGWDMAAGRDAVLLVRARCESTVIVRAGQYLERAVRHLKASRYADTEDLLFSEVRLEGRLSSVFRDARTGSLTSDADELEFIQFTIIAAVNEYTFGDMNTAAADGTEPL